MNSRLERRQRRWQALQSVPSVTVLRPAHDYTPSAEILESAPRGFSRPLSHAETITEPMELSSGLANANIATDERGRPLWKDGKVRKIIENLREFSPGTFGTVKGRLTKAKAQSSIKSQRWHHPHEEQRTIAKQGRRDRLLVGWLVAGTPSAAKQLEIFNLPIPPRGVRLSHRRKPKSSPPPPKNTLPQPSTWQPPARSPGMLAFCADIRLTLPAFQPVVIATLKPRSFAQTTPHTASAWGASTLKPKSFLTWSQSQS